MKKSFLIIVIITLVVLALGVLSCGTPTKDDTQDIPKYMADQVIYIAQAKYPVCYYNGSLDGYEMTTPSMISAKYLGDSTWGINVKSPSYKYSLIQRGSYIREIKLYFYEKDGSLSEPYLP